jgi:guanine nucleotide-binding protein subunit alpha
MESGKSTVIKQMCIMSDDAYGLKNMYRRSIYSNLLYAAQTVIKSMRELNLEPVEHRNQGHSDFLMKYTLDNDPDTPIEPKAGDAISSLWKDESVKKLMQHRTEFCLPESAP